MIRQLFSFSAQHSIEKPHSILHVLAVLENNGMNEETTHSFFLTKGLAQQFLFLNALYFQCHIQIKNLNSINTYQSRNINTRNHHSHQSLLNLRKNRSTCSIVKCGFIKNHCTLLSTIQSSSIHNISMHINNRDELLALWILLKTVANKEGLGKFKCWQTLR